MAKISNLIRRFGKKRYKKIFYLFTEGAVTEPQYFRFFNNDEIHIKHISGKNKSAPNNVLKRIKKYISENKNINLQYDEVWGVIDKDTWDYNQIKELNTWASTNKNFGIVISNPNFEYWLLLHFDDGNNIVSAKDCLSRLKKYIPYYNKTINLQLINKHMIQYAIKRARIRYNDNNKTFDNIGVTTVYQLVEKLLLTEKSVGFQTS